MSDQLTTDQVHEALDQVLTSCDLAMADYRAMSLRSALRELGYHGEQAEQIIQFVAEGGFDYCLDYTIRSKSGEYPSDSVCYWGPDQLKSRLQCLRNYTPRRH